jgi:hypothetical protein
VRPEAPKPTLDRRGFADGFRVIAAGKSPVAGRTGCSNRVDEKLTERRDDASLYGIEGTQETGADLRFSGSEPVTSDFGEVRPCLTRKRSEVQILSRRIVMSRDIVHTCPGTSFHVQPIGW